MPYASGGVLYHAASQQVLLQHRSADAPTNPNLWGLFGGGVEAIDRDDPVATWVRELREELGITIAPESAIAIGERERRDGSWRYLFYREWPTPNTDFVLGEGQGFAWFTIDAALALPNLAEGARYYLLQFRAHLSAA